MPPQPRFAPTGNRANVPTGTNLGGGAVPKVFTPTVVRPLQGSVRATGSTFFAPATGGARAGGTPGYFAEGFRDPTYQRRVNALIARGLTPAAARSAARVAIEAERRHSRPQSPLNLIQQALGVGESSVVGFFSGYTDNAPTNITWDAPWKTIKAIGAGFSEIPDAVSEGLTAEERIREVSDPNSWRFKHAKAIGITTGILVDPLTWVSLGATTTSKIAARNLIAKANRDSATEAIHMVKTGVINPRTGRRYNDINEAMMHAHIAAGRPYTTGDALAQLRGIATDYSRESRRFQHGLGSAAKAYLLPSAAMGGRGIRLAGMELPGTPQLAESIALRVGGKRAASYSEKAAAKKSIAARMFQTSVDIKQIGPAISIPGHVAVELGDDMLRSSALVAFRRQQDALQGLHKSAIDTAIEFARDKSGNLLPEAQRMGLLGGAAVTPEAKRFVQQVNLSRGRIKQRAKRLDIDDVDEVWNDVMKTARNRDAMEVFAEFQWRVNTKILSREFMEELLENPTFALRATPGRSRVEKAAYRESPPGGYVPFNHRNQKFWVRENLVDALELMKNPAVMDESTKTFWRFANKGQNFWKLYATSPNPAYHVMNLVGAVWNNFLGGVYNPIDYIKAIGVLYNARAGAAAVRAGREISGKRKEAMQLVEEARARSGLGGASFLRADIPETAAQEFRKAAKAALPRRERLLKPAPGQKRRAFATTRTRQAAGLALAGTLNPLAAVALAPEAVRLGQTVGTAVEDMVRLAPFMKGANNPIIKRAMDAYGPISIPGMRHPGFTHAEQRVMYDIGAENARHFQFDYKDLTEFERTWAKMIFPFYTYHRKNFTLQMTELVKQPRNVNAALAMANYIDEEAGDIGGMEFILPEYFDNLGAFQIPVPNPVRDKLGLPADMPLYLNPKLPFYSAFNLVPGIWNMWIDSATPTPQKFLGIISPFAGAVGPFSGPVPGAKLAIEYATNVNLGLNRPVDFQRASSNSWRNSYVPAPFWSKYVPEPMKDWLSLIDTGRGGYITTATNRHWMDQVSLPFVNNLGKAVPIGEPGIEGEKAQASLVSWLTGVRLIPADMLRLNRSWAYRLESALEGEQLELREQGKELSREDAHTLRLVRKQIKRLEKAYDKRDEELYPQ